MPSFKSILVVALSLALSVSARPYEKGRGGWGPGQSPASSMGDFSKRWGLQASSCNLQNAVANMDLSAANPPLPAPQASLSLFQVAVGRGTQNYTCDLSNATATPVPIGAVASLYDVSCVADYAPELLSVIPTIAVDLPLPDTTDPNSPMAQDLTGHHYFLDSTTPFFNLDTAEHQYGMGALQKVNASDAPSDAYAGVGGQGNGAVQWLMLNQKPFVEDAWKQVYRLNTAGGAAPKTCTGSPAAFEVQYAAVYWLFK